MVSGTCGSAPPKRLVWLVWLVLDPHTLSVGKPSAGPV
jgi:hypothetical protein